MCVCVDGVVARGMVACQEERVLEGESFNAHKNSRKKGAWRPFFRARLQWSVKEKCHGEQHTVSWA